ncbi:carbohydrate ABC transporter permease [Enterococcus sp. DIV0240d]|uniref:carbohydrate ABC transporter permease n=1 Tax=Enterococcus sp. DIV0240d TaxID=2774717 RepID=UPI003F24531C
MKKKKFEHYNRYGYLFIAPFLIIFIIFQLYPILYTMGLSFTDLSGWNTEFNFVGLDNFKNLIKNDLFWQATKNTFLIWTLNFIPQLSLAMLLASLLTNAKLKIKGATFFKIMFYLPNIITAASVSIIFFALFSYPAGPINQALLSLGIIDTGVDFFRNTIITRGIVIFVQFWMYYGSTTIVLISGILSIDESLFEAARIDGATGPQIFRHVTLPLLKPITLYTLITSLIGGLQMFDIPFLLTNGGPNNSVTTITMFIYNQAFLGNRNTNVASTASVVLLAFSLCLSTIVFRLFRDRKVKV